MTTPGNAQFRMAAHWPHSSLVSFRLNYASGVPTISKDSAGILASVADTGTGVITVTFAEAWLECYIVGCEMITASINDHAIPKSRSEGGVPVIAIWVIDASAGSAVGAAADLDGDIDVTVMLCNTPAN
jgi:hypothetical protein